MRVEGAFACHGALAAYVQRLERVDLAGVGHADAHADLCHDGRIGDRRLHAAVFERQALVAGELGKDRRSRDRVRRKLERLAGARVAERRGDVGGGCGNQCGADSVVGLRALDVRLHDFDARGPAVVDRGLHAGDRRFLYRERLGRCGVRRRCGFRRTAGDRERQETGKHGGILVHVMSLAQVGWLTRRRNAERTPHLAVNGCSGSGSCRPEAAPPALRDDASRLHTRKRS